MEDKVLWIALKLFMVWLFVMAFCLCICNCLFIRSDRQKSKEAKSAASRTVLERHKRLERQYCDCEDEKLVGGAGGGGPGGGGGKGQRLSSQETEPLMQGSSGLGYIQRTANPRFTLQHPSADDVNLSQLIQPSSICIDIGPVPETTGAVVKNSGRLSSELLRSLLRTPSDSGKYLLFGKEERFPRIETASNPALNVEKFPAPTRMPYVTKKRFPEPTNVLPALAKSARGDSTSRSNSNSSIALPQTPSFVITEVEGLDRPRSSSFSGQDSSRYPSPYRPRLTPSPTTPTPSSLSGSDQHPSPLLPRHRIAPSAPDNPHLVLDMPQDAQPNYDDLGTGTASPSTHRHTNGFNSNRSSTPSTPDSDSQVNHRRSIVSDV